MLIMRGDHNNDNSISKAQRLSAAIRDGDETAFVSFYEDRILHVTGSVEKVTGNRDEAWDIAQDTFAKLWQQRSNIDPEKSLDALVKAMATNTAINAVKQRKTHARYHREQLFLQNDEDLSADTRMLSHELQRKVDSIISQMPPRQREVFLLSREKDMTYNQIAQQLGISPLTVRTHISTALHELRSLLSALAVALIVN